MNGNRLHREAVQSVCPWRRSESKCKGPEQTETWKLGLLGVQSWTKHPPEVPTDLNLSMALICDSMSSILMGKKLPKIGRAKSLM